MSLPKKVDAKVVNGTLHDNQIGRHTRNTNWQILFSNFGHTHTDRERASERERLSTSLFRSSSLFEPLIRNCFQLNQFVQFVATTINKTLCIYSSLEAICRLLNVHIGILCRRIFLKWSFTTDWHIHFSNHSIYLLINWLPLASYPNRTICRNGVRYIFFSFPFHFPFHFHFNRNFAFN